MAATSLNIFNHRRMINNMISQGPRSMILRELLVNAFEAVYHITEGHQRLIRVINDNGKLVVINSGQGMDAQELEDALQLTHSGSYKNQATHRGEGAKVASLAFNTEGFVMRSRKNGVLSQGRIFYDAKQGEWQFIMDTLVYASVVGSHIDPKIVVTQDDIKRYQAFPGDFTEVKLWGMSPGHQTAFEPYDDVTPTTIGKVPLEVFDRFYNWPALPGPLTSVDVRFDPSFIRAGTSRPFRTFAEVIAFRQNDKNSFEHLNARFAHPRPGVTFEFVKHVRSGGNTGGGRGPWTNYSFGHEGAMAALVYDGEMYDVHAEDWPNFCSNFGLSGLKNEVSLMIHLESSYPGVTIDRYRERLMLNRKPMSLLDFADEVQRNRPAWIQALVLQNIKTKRPGRRAFAKLLPFAAKIFAWSKIGNNQTIGGANPRGNSNNLGVKPRNKPSTPGNGTGSGNGQGGTKPRTGSANQSKPGGHAAPPNMSWVNTTTAVGTGLLPFSGAAYISSINTLFLNEDYWMFDIMVDEVRQGIAKQYPGVLKPTHQALTRQIIGDAIKEKVELRVGATVLLGMGKSQISNIPAQLIADSQTQGALSAVYDSCDLEIPDLVRDCSRVSAIQAM